MIRVFFTNSEDDNGTNNDRRRTIIETLGWQMRAHAHPWSPPTDLFETETSYIVRVEIAGMREQDFSVKFDNSYLAVSGFRPDIPERRAYHQMEIRSGEFSTVVAIPGPVDSEKATAEYTDGFLTVSLPKATPSRIHIRE